MLQHSIVRHASEPVAICPLILKQLPIKRKGLTEFTYSRFLVPYICGFKGRALFLDADMVVTGDVSELFNSEEMSAVSVMQEQPKFEWASMMMFNCSACSRLAPEFIDNEENQLFDLKWAPYVGKLDPSWNHCVGYQEPKDAKLYHYTQGLPCFPETQGLPEDAVWNRESDLMNSTVSWKELMGRSVHREPVLRRLLSKYQ